ncbi:hypothetical protein HY967_00085 [Candidatus Jorgensenbacteria bacterium]|nr:hypothetical protein [Candidatus Jorgensenbacteria bacterium]
MDHLGKWSSFEDEKNYHIENLGRPAIFLIPSHKLERDAGGITVRRVLHEFLTEKFGAYTTSIIPSFGFWNNEGDQLICDECCQYEVSFDGKGKVPLLLKKLAEIAKLIREDCIYLKAGQYTCLVSPPKKS